MTNGRRFDASLGEVSRICRREAIRDEIAFLRVVCRYLHDVLTLPRIMIAIYNMDNSGEYRQEEFSFTRTKRF